MGMPGFVADASLYPTNKHYYVARTTIRPTSSNKPPVLMESSPVEGGLR